MRASEILRKLADVIDSAESGVGDHEQPNRAELEPVKVDHKDATDPNTMVPPLQQKLELLKKASGVDNMFDKEEPHDELTDIKKLTGISPVIHHIHSDDAPFGE